MTREEIEELKGLAASMGLYDDKKPCKRAVILGKAIKALEQEPRWIPVSERLPEIADVYRVTRYYPNNVMNPNYLVDACFFDGSNTWYNDNRINHERGYVDNIIAWQENPEPYKIEPQKVRIRNDTTRVNERV